MLRLLLQAEFINRHGFGVMSDKLKPVHVANGLFRQTLGVVGRTQELMPLFRYTASTTDEQEKAQALRTLVEHDAERWGSLVSTPEASETSLGPVLRMLRTLLAADGAVFGTTPDKSSFSTPTGRLITPDISDEHAGAFIHHLWSQEPGANALLARLAAIVDPELPPEALNDLAALFVPLAGEGRTARHDDKAATSSQDLAASEVCQRLKQGAADLAAFEQAANPNPIATLERTVTLACLSLFRFTSTRLHELHAAPPPVLLLDALGAPTSDVAAANTASCSATLDDARRYLGTMLREMLEEATPPGGVLDLQAAAEVLQQRLQREGNTKDRALLASYQGVADEALRQGGGLEEVLEDLLDELHRREDTSSDWLRLFGVRTGLLYPQQRTPKKRVVPTDRVVEVLVAASMDVTKETLEYRAFLDRLWDRFGIITGGRPEDDQLLRRASLPRVSSKGLRANADHFLERLASQGLARPMADSVALVGLLEH